MNEKFGKTIKEIADDLNVTKQDVYQKRRSEPLFSELKPHTHKNNGIIYISNEGIELLKQALFPIETNVNTAFSTAIPEPQESIFSSDTEPPIINTLPQEINEQTEQATETPSQEPFLETHESTQLSTNIPDVPHIPEPQKISAKTHHIDMIQENTVESSEQTEDILVAETDVVAEEDLISVAFVSEEEVSIVPSVVSIEKTEPVSDTLLEQLQAVTKFSEMLQAELKSKNKIIATQQNTINELTAIIKSHAQSVHIDKQTAFMKQFLATKLLKPVKLAQNKNTKSITTHNKNTKKSKTTQLNKKRRPRV